ncbi:MAG: ATP-binding cassette domain-containing protein [Ktedonobacteraceae bacterium]|nr:ATP-binding cassette domain-containing protein [Ktedonobacteraceae bacterium]
MQPSDTIGYWLSYAQRYYASAFFEVLRAHCIERGKAYVITPPQWGVIALLSHDDGQTISTLALQLGVDAPAVTNIVKRIEQSGLVQRIRDREDQRVVKVFLTSEGQDIIRSLDQVVTAFNEQVLPGDQQQGFLKQLHHLIARVSTVTPGAGDRFGLLKDYMQQEVSQSTKSSPRMTPAIEIIDLCKTFGSLRAVDHLSLSVQQGEIFGLLGPNGSGKTTTINMLSGLSVPTSGEVRVMGYNVRRHAREVRQLLGAVPQETALYEELSAWANLDFHADLFGIPPKEKKKRITTILTLVQLLDRKDSPVRTFSGGMKRRLALGRALLHDPQLIYLDEPTLGVDVQARRAIWDYILSLRDQGKTVLITTNYLEEAQALCERLAIIDHGTLVALDTPEHLKQTYGGSVVEVETAKPTVVLEMLRALAGVKEVKQEGTHLTIVTEGINNVVPQIINIVSHESELDDLAVREPTLDEIFLHLTGTALRD